MVQPFAPTSIEDLEARLAHASALVKRLHLQYEVAGILAEAQSVDDAMHDVLTTLGRTKGWDLTQAWLFDDDHVQHFYWFDPDVDVAAYLEASRRLDFAQGGHAPARALEAGDVVWIPELKQLPNATRQASAAANNICNVLVFVLRHGQCVYGVIELASTQCDPPEEGMRQLFRLLGRDIGRFLEAMKYEAELEKKNARLAQAQRIARMGHWEWRPLTGQLHINNGTLRALGFDPDQHNPLPTLDAYFARLSDADRDRLSAQLDEVQDFQRTEVEAEHVFNCRDGNPRMVVLRAEAQTDRHGRLNRVVGMVQDVTERRRAEAQLRLIAKAVEQAAEAMVILDASGTIISVNPAFTRITGYAGAEAAGRLMDELLHRPTGRHDDAFFRRVVGFLLADGHWEGEVWALRKNGEVFPELLSISVIRDDNDSVANYVGVFNDITDQKEQEDRLKQLALYDSLTGLPNRTLWREHLEQAMTRSARQQRKIAVLFCDLDRFKPVNDTFGHEVGDQLLKQVADRLRSAVRASDLVSRLGGDEFVVVLESIASEADAGQVAHKIVDAIGNPFFVGKYDIDIGTSVGIAFYPDHGDKARTLLRRADQALYQAKEAGRNGYQVWAPSIAG